MTYLQVNRNNNQPATYETLYDYTNCFFFPLFLVFLANFHQFLFEIIEVYLNRNADSFEAENEHGNKLFFKHFTGFHFNRLECI